jgi:peptide/nickel transport system permease protein
MNRFELQSLVSKRIRQIFRISKNSSLILGSFLLCIILGAAIFCPFLTPYDPISVDLSKALSPPNRHNLLGTDNFGRDVLTRILYGARVDLKIGFLCVLFPFIIGVFAGSVAGYFGRWIDSIIMRIVDVVWAFPFYVLIIAIVGLLGPGIQNIYIAVTLVSWISFARIVRGEILVIKQSEYILAAKALGYSKRRIILRHIIPNVISPAIIFAMADIVLTILAITSLSFLGLGIQPPTPEWGLMVADGRTFITGAWWISTFPGVAIIIVGITFTLLGDGLDDYLRPEG